MFVKLKGDQVTEVKLKIFEPPRLFEAFLRGRHLTEIPDIVARIGHRALEELLHAHRLWGDWLREGRVRKIALVAEKT